MTEQAVIKNSTDGRQLAVVGDIYRFMAVGSETDGKYAVFEAIISPGGGPPPHTHSREQESFYVIEGEITFQVGNELQVAGPGTFVNIPIGMLHAFRNATTEPAKMIISVVPAGLEEMFFEIGQPPPPPGEFPPLPTKAEIEKLLQTAPRYGVEVHLPPH